MTADRALRFGPAAVTVALLALAPVLVGDFYVSAVLTKALWLGIAAASLIFLAAYAGMVSLGQVALYGIAAFTMANVVAADGGSDIAWNPWAGAFAGLVAAVAVGLFFGAISSRSYGIYFLMITLAFAVLTYFFFGQVTQLSGFGGVNNVDTPDFVGNRRENPVRFFYIALAAAAAVYVLVRYVARTPFGLTLQGIRDDPARMRALGFNVPLHRTIAFGVGAAIAAVAGILSVWWNPQISPGSIALPQTIDVLVIAVIGGLFRLEGAWVGAFVFAILDHETRGVGVIGERFNTVVGVVFLAIVLLSPGGLMGIWTKVTGVLGGLRPAGRLRPDGAVAVGEEPRPAGDRARGP